MEELKKQKQSDEIFCWSCGEPIKKEAVICVHCGVQVRPLAPSAQRSHVSAGAPDLLQNATTKPKSKSTAVLLAVFLGYWTWLYTAARDKAKFVLGLGLQLLACSAWLPIPFTHSLYQFYGIFILAAFAMWIYAIIDASVKSRDWYAAYPNG